MPDSRCVQRDDATTRNSAPNLPVFLNPDSGSAKEIDAVLSNDSRVTVHRMNATELADAIAAEAAKGTPRIVISGGDGTVALAASIVAGSQTALAVLPGGTLNHFARRHGIPTDYEKAIDCALTGEIRSVDVGFVNDRLFINTSSLGAYVAFVRSRNRLQRHMNYYFASISAGIRRLLRLQSHRLRLGETEVRTPLIFIGVGERELRFPFLGDNKNDGTPSLHVIAVRHDHWLDALKLAVNAALRGIAPLDRENAVDNHLTKDITISPRHKKQKLLVAVDGELVWLQPPLRYRLAAKALHLVCPKDDC